MSEFKMTFGRKFWVAVWVSVLLIGILIMSTMLNKEAVNAAVLLLYGTFLTTLGIAYIGGNVWNNWVNSKFFKKGD